MNSNLEVLLYNHDFNFKNFRTLRTNNFFNNPSGQMYEKQNIPRTFGRL